MQLHDTTQEVKLCECGCGQPAPIAKRTSARDGWIKGQPKRFISGHNGRKRSHYDILNPNGFCICGCGQRTTLAPYSDAVKGWAKDKPLRFVKGHQHKAQHTPTERFWNMVIIRNDSECWDWEGAKHEFGYGLLGINKRTVRAHRFSWEIHFGPIPDGLQVLHKCDNPPCSNPKHLFLGTDADNSADKMAKGRHGHTGSPGESHPNAKLTDALVRAIRQRVDNGEAQSNLAKEYDISLTTLNRIVRRINWRHVP